MTTEPAKDGEFQRRKSDDIASLFRPLVAGNGPSSMFPPHRTAFIPLPPTYTSPVRRPEAEPPEHPETDARVAEETARAEAEAPGTAAVGSMPRASGETRIEPTMPSYRPAAVQPARAGPTEIPWPDAFEPRPNYRKPERSGWMWLLLIPAGLVAAVAVTMVDPRSVRTWVDTNILHRTPVTGTLDSPLLPDAFRKSGTSTVAPAADNAPTAPTPIMPTMALPTTEALQMLPEPVQTAAAAAAAPPAAVPIHVTIQFRRNIPGADGEARRIAALLQSSGGSIELHPSATTARAATINYYNPADKDAASALATVLANEASWIVRLGTSKSPLGTIDVWLP